MTPRAISLSASAEQETHAGSPRWRTPPRETHEGGYLEPGKSRLENTQWTRKGSEPCSWVDRVAQICPGKNQNIDRWHHGETRLIVQTHDWEQLFEHHNDRIREKLPQ